MRSTRWKDTCTPPSAERLARRCSSPRRGNHGHRLVRERVAHPCPRIDTRARPAGCADDDLTQLLGRRDVRRVSRSSRGVACVARAAATGEPTRDRGIPDPRLAMRSRVHVSRAMTIPDLDRAGGRGPTPSRPRCPPGCASCRPTSASSTWRCSEAKATPSHLLHQRPGKPRQRPPPDRISARKALPRAVAALTGTDAPTTGGTARPTRVGRGESSAFLRATRRRLVQIALRHSYQCCVQSSGRGHSATGTGE